MANYFGVNGTFQLLPAFNRDHFTLRGRYKAHTEIPDKSCKWTLLYIYTTEIWLGICMLSTICVKAYMFLPIIALPNRWTRSISFDWSHSRSCSGNCNAYSVLLFQVTTGDICLFMYTIIVALKYCLSSTVGWLGCQLNLPSRSKASKLFYSFK